jgi:hypothetical protein
MKTENYFRAKEIEEELKKLKYTKDDMEAMSTINEGKYKYNFEIMLTRSDRYHQRWLTERVGLTQLNAFRNIVYNEICMSIQTLEKEFENL